MKTDVTYCNADDKCKKRYFCKRYIGNYLVDELKEVENYLEYLNPKVCINNSYKQYMDSRKG